MFTVEQIAEDCRMALGESNPQAAVREVIAQAVADPSAVMAALGEPKRSEIQSLYQSEDLTILNVLWAPKMTIAPHNHEMWAVIGIYTGREDSILWRRLPDREDGKVEAIGARALGEKDTDILGHDLIHSVTNPVGRLTGAIHVYGGDFFGVERSEWDSEHLTERPFSVEKNMAYFEELNAQSR